MQISEIRPGAGIELKAEISEIKPLRKLWKCIRCKNTNKEPFKGVWKEEEFRDDCPNCGLPLSYGKGIQHLRSVIIKDDSGEIWLDLWNQDAELNKYSKGDKIHLINGYARKHRDGINVSKGKFGSILRIKENI